jgi:uncharacterized radical SAM superfamily Fe-S cluster-containing enzyme
MILHFRDVPLLRALLRGDLTAPARSQPTTVRSWCPKCGKPACGELFRRDGDLHLRRTCEHHGTTEVLFWKRADLFELSALDGPLLPEGQLDVFDPAVERFTTTLALDVTVRCNLACPSCFSQALLPGKGKCDEPQTNTRATDPTLEQLLSRIPDYRGRRRHPTLSLIGGESALRDDLPEIVRAFIAERGLEPRLCSNGLLLTPERLARLHGAGLRWIILQFDGFEAASSQALRGVDLSNLKLELVSRIERAGLKVHLAVMVKKGVNDHELGSILRFAGEHPVIRRVSFYPCSATGRASGGGATAEVTYLDDVLGALDRGTGGELSADRVLSARRLADRLFRLTRLPMFRPRPCVTPFLVQRRDGRLLLSHELLTPIGALSHPAAFASLLAGAPKLLHQYSDELPPEFLFVSIEKFYDDDAFLVEGARNCHHLYLTERGVFPFCVYNSCERGRR